MPSDKNKNDSANGIIYGALAGLDVPVESLAGASCGNSRHPCRSPSGPAPLFAPAILPAQSPQLASNPGSPYRGRFAPSPTGPLHFGSLVAAVGSWLRARSEQGIWLVRMEDLDPPREVSGAAADILATLTAFGMESDEPVMFQSRREAAYHDAFQRLLDTGQVFACACSRSELEAQGGLHRGVCIGAADLSRPSAWRLRAPELAIGFDDLALGPQAQNLRHDPTRASREPSDDGLTRSVSLA